MQEVVGFRGYDVSMMREGWEVLGSRCGRWLALEGGGSQISDGILRVNRSMGQKWFKIWVNGSGKWWDLVELVLVLYGRDSRCWGTVPGARRCLGSGGVALLKKEVRSWEESGAGSGATEGGLW